MTDYRDIQNWNAENIGHFPGKDLPATYVNRFQILSGSDLTRIVFGESLVGELEATWSSALVMTTADAVALAELILSLAAQSQSKNEQSDAKATTDA